MPSKSKAQHNLMAMVANDPAASKRVGIPQSVGEEYVKADKGKKFGTGTSRARPDLQKVNKPSTRHGKSEFFAEGGMATKMNPGFMAMMKKKAGGKKMAAGGVAASKMGAVKTAAPSKDGVAVKGKTKGKMVKMKYGGKC